MGQKKRTVKVVKVQHGYFNRPHARNISRAIEKWTGKGYQLQSEAEERPGCIGFIFPFQGQTRLTFILYDR